MLDYIAGKVVERKEGCIVLEKGGFGFSIYVGNPSEFDGDCKIYTYLQIKQEAITLYGFKTRQERDLFVKLLSLHGVGVKHAFSILSNLDPQEFVMAIQTQNTSLLESIPGIGKKTAHRLIVELKGRLDFEEDQKLQDIVDTLLSLGYSRDLAIKVSCEVAKENLPVEDAIKKAINMASKNV